jgi:hypothetical protein
MLLLAMWHFGLGHVDAARWEPFSGGRYQVLTVAESPGSRLTMLAPEQTGVRFTNFLARERHLTNQILLNGSGVAASDIDGDGRCDLFFCGLGGASALYRNLGGWRFEDVTAQSGAVCAGLDATGAAFADLEGDGDLDLLVNTVGAGTRVFTNDGKGRFSEASPALNLRRCGSSLALADIDGDGDLDCYVANYRVVTIRDQPNTRFSIRTVDGRPQVISVDDVPVTHPDLADRFNYRISEQGGRGNFAYDENGEADMLLRNEGGGRFVLVSFTDGSFLDEQGRPLAKPPFDWGLSAMFRDLNGDGAPDLYVCNDFKSPDRVWVNDGRGRFRALAPLAIRQMSLSSMGVDFADVNRDGFDDFIVLDMLSREHVHRFSQRIDIRPEVLPVGVIDNRPSVPRNTLFVNRGDGTWAECAQFSGLEAAEWAWTPIFLDVDLDGYEDLLVSNGFERDGMNVDVLRRLEMIKQEKPLASIEQLHLRKMFPRLDTANLAFRNLGGLKFKNVSDAWGFNLRGVSQGMGLADFDNDGDQDIVINNLNAPASLYRNESAAPRLAVRLKGTPPNTHGIGARIKVTGGPVAQSQEMISGGRYLSSDEAMRTFAAGSLTNALTIDVVWRSGRRSVVEGARANCLYEIEEDAASPSRDTQPAARNTPVFTDLSSLLNHTHTDEPFDDFALQPTLSRRLSQLGPGVSWFDVDGDGWEDLIVGSGRGGRLAVFRNDGRGGFTPLNGTPYDQPVTRDQTTIVGLRQPDGQVTLLAGSASYEDGLTNGSVARQYHLARKTVEDGLPGASSSTGPLALADVDGDGDLDLFVGGRVRPGRYPEAVSSLLFRNNAGRLDPDQSGSTALANVGLVSGAVFSDLDGDGDPDLVLACEWGPLQILRNDGGRLIAWDWPIKTLNAQRSTLNQMTGWWNGVTTGDFDGDGRLDIAASNWGQNTRYESFRDQPLRAFHGEAAGDGVMHCIEAYTSAGSGRLLPFQPFHLMGLAMPAMRERVGTFEKYAHSTLPEIYGESWPRLAELRAVHLESTVFLNRGSHFQAIVLPLEAQLAPAFAVCAGDLDGDGHEDLFLSQNFFAVHPEYSRHDAGRGLWLRGDGRGGFAAVPGQQSGLLIYGEQRGAALGDYDGDGRTDLAIAQNAAPTKLYRNTGAKPGLRIRLVGPPGNPSAVGAVLRLASGQKLGPAREVHAGSGYWSQDSAVQVLAMPEAVTGLWVRWPGGMEQSVSVPAGTREITVEPNGELRVVR